MAVYVSEINNYYGGGVGIGIGELRERFLVDNEQLGMVSADGMIGYRPSAILPQGDNVVYCGLQIPVEFQSLISVLGVFISGADGNLNWDANTNYGRICTETYFNHTETVVGQVAPFLEDVLTCIDLSGVFAGIAAGDNIGLQFVRNAAGSTIDGSIHAIGVRLRFNM